MSTDHPLQPLLGRDILLVEDEPLIVWMVEDMLRTLGARDVTATSHARDAIEVLSAMRIDLAVLDVHSSCGTSHELARRLKAAGTPVLFMSGSGPEELPADLQHIPLLTKPFGEEEFRLAIFRPRSGVVRSGSVPEHTGSSPNTLTFS